MKKILPLLASLGLILFLLSACANDQHYNQYEQAYQQLEKADSFVLERSSSLTQSKNVAGTVNKTDTAAAETWQVIHNKAGYTAIAKIVFTPTNESSPR